MNKPTIKLLALALTISGLVTQVSFAYELLNNGDLPSGRSGWKIEGNSNVEPAAAPDKGLVVNLNARHWTYLRQEIRLNKKGQSAINIKVELQASPDFKRAQKSDEYADLDWEEGNYGWTGNVNPKCDFMVTVSNGGGWDYRTRKLKPGQPQTITADVQKLKVERSVFTLALPPGEGSVTLRLVSVKLRD
ncbi:MAG: hypothetical protein LBD30_03375 [Verrucomicrobiales bacterium]|jgi:hypothetical protein|nr:hypothetical protein [Verrucomicrobiales bacterium]